jgi:protein-disulfide isomerase
MATTTTTRQSRRTGRTLPRPTARKTAVYEAPELVIPVDLSRDHVQGDPKAILTLVEYGDYQCPFCGAAYPEVKKVQKELGPKLRFIFRNFPLTNVHEYAMAAAETAEAAGAQGKLWEMHDFLYEHQDTLGDHSVALGYARKLGLDTQRFEREVAQHVYEKRIKDDFIGGVRSGVNGTPTFYVNGVRHDGPAESEALIESLTAKP